MSVKGVTAQPGGRVAVSVGAGGLAIEPVARWDWIEEPWAVGLSALWMLVGLIGGASILAKQGLGAASTPIGLLVLLLAVVGGVPVMLHLLSEALGFLVFLLMLPLLPLLLFPGVRRMLGRAWGRKRSGARAAEVAALRVYAGPVVDVRYADGRVVRLSAQGEAGERLLAELRKLRLPPGRRA